MFTTTLTKSVEKSLPVSVGDVFDWSDGSYLYRVTAVDLNKQTHQIAATAYGRDGDSHSSHYSLGNFSHCKHLRVAGAVDTTLTVEEPFVNVEHKFQVGDVIEKDYCGEPRRYTIEAISLTSQTGRRTDGPFYIYDGVGRFDQVSSIDNQNRNNITLVGGPRFTPPQPEWKFQIGDVFETHYPLSKSETWTIESYAYDVNRQGWHYVIDVSGNRKGWLEKDFEPYERDHTLVGGPSFVPPVPTKLEILKSARELIALPEKWGKGKFKQGGAYCALGAINVAAGSSTADGTGLPTNELRLVAHQARESVEEVIGRQNIWMWNDASDRTHEQVLAAFDVAIGQEVLAR